MFKNANKGFTLAEVLITLAVIGVVAAMSIPALMGSTNSAELRVGLKKAVSVLNQAVTMSIALNSEDAQSYTGKSTAGGATQAQALRDWFATRLNVLSTGGNGTTSPYLITADGLLYTFKSGATGECGSVTALTAAANPCGVMVDVNGAKKPNAETTSSTALKDQFFLVIKKSSVIPGEPSSGTASAVQDALSGG